MSENNAETRIDTSVPNGNSTYRVGSFAMPCGITKNLPVNAVPAPVVQIGLGLPFKMDLKVRFVPKLNFDDDIEASLFGLGLQRFNAIFRTSRKIAIEHISLRCIYKHEPRLCNNR